MKPSLPQDSGTRQEARRDIRVMVVDDAAVVRGLLRRWIDGEAGLVTAATARSGRDALEQLEQADPDVVLLDVEMPQLDGLSALPLLLERRRDLVVIMASSLTRDHAEITLKALTLGAADYIPKPQAEGLLMTSANFRRELIDKVRALGQRPSMCRQLGPFARHPAARQQADVAPRATRRRPEGSVVAVLRPFSPAAPRALLIGASTGGPRALAEVLTHLDAVIGAAPVLIAQHMPPNFTAVLAEHLARACARSVREAVDGESVLVGHVYVAPGGRHMRVERRDGGPIIVLDDGPAIHFCKPAVDPLFSSAAAVWGAASLALVLTGMGCDGTAGAADIVAAGGSVIAQDETTSVIWGMPGSAVEAGLCSAVLPLAQIAPKVARLFRGAKP